MKEVKGDEIIVNGDLKTEVDKIKQQPGKDIWLFGGASLISSFLNESLIDEFSLAVHPVILGGGKPLFCDVNARISLKLVDTKTYSTGLVSLSYVPA